MKKLIIALLLLPSLSFAAPSITGSSGTYSHGNSITITGSNFGSKSHAKPVVWAPFEGSTVAADSSLSYGTLINWGAGNYQLDTTNQPHSLSTQSISNMAKIDPYPERLDGKHPGDVRTYISTGKYFVFSKRKFPVGVWAATSNFKTYWAYPAVSGCTSNSAPYVVTVVDRLTWFAVTIQGGNFNPGGGAVGPIPGYYPPEDGSWTNWEIQEKKGTLDNYDGIFKFWIDGQLIANWTPKNVATYLGTPTPTTFCALVWGDFWTETVAGKSYPLNEKDYLDDVYMDDTWARVMIGNAPTFNACTHREPLIPTAWSATSITAYFNQGSFVNGSTAYLFVVDSDGNASPGYQITIAGTASDTTAPWVDQPSISPAKSSTGNSATNRQIQFHVFDDIAVTTSGTVTIKGVPYTCGAGLTCTGLNTNNMTVTYTKGSDWSYDDNVTVSVDGFKDAANNTMTTDSWWFTIESSSQPPPNITTTSPLAERTQGTAFSQQFTAESGVSPYTWSIYSGSLPSGTNLSSSGVFSGTPTTPGPYNFTVKILDANSVEDTQALYLIVNPLTPGGQYTVNVTDIADTYINVSSGGDDNYSDNTYAEVYVYPVGVVANRVLDNIAISLPNNVIIVSAKLYLYNASYEGSGGTNPMTVNVYRVSGDVPDISTVTWNTFTGTLESPESSASVSLVPGWYSWTVTDAVAWAYANTSPLYLALDGGGASDTNRQFTSMEGAAGYRPFLSVTYRQQTSEGVSISAPGKMRVSKLIGRFR